MPNVSEGVDQSKLRAIAAALVGLKLIDVHCDEDHGRSVFSLLGRQGTISAGLVSGARAAVESIDVGGHQGIHPHIGSVDVCPVVYLRREDRGAACAEALVTANLLADQLNLPVFLYGELADGRERAEIRRGGPEELSERMRTGDLKADFGPDLPHPTAGATLVGARPPLVAFNLLLKDAPLDLAVGIATKLRESGGGLPGVRAIGLWLDSVGRAQVSCNVHDSVEVPLSAIVDFVGSRAEVASAELVGLAPEVAFAGFPSDLPIPGFDPKLHLIENVLKADDLA